MNGIREKFRVEYTKAEKETKRENLSRTIGKRERRPTRLSLFSRGGIAIPGL